MWRGAAPPLPPFSYPPADVEIHRKEAKEGQIPDATE